MKNLYQKINEVMLEVTTVQKGVQISMGGGGYSAVSHDDVTRLLHIPIARAGIVLASSVINSDLQILEKSKEWNGKITIIKEYMVSVTVELTAINSDDPSERLSVNMPSIAFDPSDKAFGKAISMATKYAYLKLFMLESVDKEEERDDHGYEYKNKPQETKKIESKPIEKPKTLVQQSKDEGILLNEIRQKLSELTTSKTPSEKMDFLKARCGVSSFGELINKPSADLVKILNSL
jgi:hypothetical protein